MRGCTFADNFVTLSRIADNYGTVNGTGTTADYGLTTDGNGWISYDSVTQDGTATAVVRFRTTEAASAGTVLLSTSVGAPGGFAIYLTATSVEALYGKTPTIETALSVDVDYTDGEWHTATYVMDMTGNSHTLYVDDLDADTAATTLDTEIGSTVRVAGDGTNNFAGDIDKARIFDQLLTEEEHVLYYNDSVTSWLLVPYGAYRCDDFGDDTDGDLIWDRTVNTNDIIKGDGATSSTFPTKVDLGYEFDYVDDYVTLPSYGSTYTISAVTSTPQIPYPEWHGDNDDSLTALLTGSGDFQGYLHNTVIEDRVLTQMELYYAEYQAQYWQSRGRASDYFNRLITEGTCKFAMFPGSDYYLYRDYSASLRDGIANNVTPNGLDGISFLSSTSYVRYGHDSDLNLTDGSIVFDGDFDTSSSSNVWMEKTDQYDVRYSSGEIKIRVNGVYEAAITWTPNNNKQLAITWRYGKAPRFYVDSEYFGDGDDVVTPGASTSDLYVGNQDGGGNQCDYKIQAVGIYDQPLSDLEIKALYESAHILRSTNMETGNRTSVINTYTGAVSQTVDPGGPFQLIDVAVELSAAATRRDSGDYRGVYL
jgi:hypothetical protein